MRYDEILYDSVRFGKFGDSMRYGEIWQDLMRFSETQRDLVVNIAADQPFWTISNFQNTQIKLDQKVPY